MSPPSEPTTPARPNAKPSRSVSSRSYLAEDKAKDEAVGMMFPKEQAALSFNSTEELTTDDQEDSDEQIEKEENLAKDHHVPLFHHMVVMPWPYLVFWPLIFAFLIGFGWTQSDIIEDEVTKIWIPTSGQYAQNLEYAEQYGKNKLGATSFAAMSIARDGGNLFEESRLEEIRARMEKTEKTTVRTTTGNSWRFFATIRLQIYQTQGID